MKLLKIALAQAAVAVALFSASPQAGATTGSTVVNKGDLAMSLIAEGANAEGKGDCGCAESLYDNSIWVSGFHQGYGEDVQTVIITPAAAPVDEETGGESAIMTLRNKPKRIAMRGNGISLRRKPGRSGTCVFGAPNASGCKRN